MAEKIARIDLLKTFVKSAEVMMKELNIEEPGDMWYRKVSKTVSELYPALQQAAVELNRDYGFNVKIPSKMADEGFPRAEAFYRLHQDILSESEGNKAFQQGEFLFNPAKKSFEKRVEAVGQELDQNGDEFNRYWMNRILTLDNGFAGEMSEEIFSNIVNEFSEVQMAEKMVSTLVKRGAIIDASDVDGVRNVLANAADEYAKNPDFVSEAEIVKEMVKRFQADCSWDGKSAAVRQTVAEYTEDFTAIIAENRPILYKYTKNHETAQEKLADFDNCLPDASYAQLDSFQQKGRELGISAAKIAVPEHYDLNQIFVDYEADALLAEQQAQFVPGSREAFWHDYAAQENADDLLWEDVGRIIGQMLMIADKDLNDAGTLLDELESRSYEENADSDEEDEDDDFDYKPEGSFSEPESEDDIEKKTQILTFAAEILDLNSVIKNFYNIEMNETPVDRKIIKKFKPGEKWDDFTYSSLNMLFDDFNSHLSEYQSLLLPDKNDPGIRPEAVEEITELPSSLEKRNLLKLFKQGLFKMEYEAINQKLEFENAMVDDFTIFHQEEYQQLTEELKMGQEIFSEIDDECLVSLVKDINNGTVTKFLVPLYDDCEPDENAEFMLMEGIIDLEELSAETRSFVRGAANRYVDRVLKAHGKLLDDGDFDRDLYEAIEEYKEYDENIENICENRLMINDAYPKEEQIYRQYRSFKKSQKPAAQPFVLSNLLANRYCNN